MRGGSFPCSSRSQRSTLSLTRGVHGSTPCGSPPSQRTRYPREGADALHNVVVDCHRNVVQAKREHHRGILSEVCWGERLSSCELCHDIDKRKGEVMQVLLGWMGSQGDRELVLQPPEVEVMELVTTGGASLWYVQL
jgi:hypothetical protein